ncbi:hypothetical protein J4Q44_G00318590 [Coregonus suidteri]|uniref:BUB1 N-terminal domain-containing protein n=1 Tax=Coregonus suidteri TaxID=861788 RepID=A0AAN8QFP6_9TELE
MNVGSHLQSFEESLSNYTGDDPLDPWDRFIEYLEKRLPAEDSKGMSLVLDRLVQRFLQEERYSNDIRYFEQQGLLQQADAVYQRAMENQAEPADTGPSAIQEVPNQDFYSGTGASGRCTESSSDFSLGKISSNSTESLAHSTRTLKVYPNSCRQNSSHNLPV